jgi:hypothetical protein
MSFKKYNENLRMVSVDGVDYAKSYSTLVARVEDSKLIELGRWSKTTTKHVNYVAKQLGLELVRFSNN